MAAAGLIDTHPRPAGRTSSRVVDMVVSLASRERGPALTHRRGLGALTALAPITSPALHLADGL
jgi:hypothetical protein